jgi:hypothetical protein
VGFFLSVEAFNDWIDAGRSIDRGGGILEGKTQFVLLKTNIIKPNSKKKPNFTLRVLITPTRVKSLSKIFKTSGINLPPQLRISKRNT